MVILKISCIKGSKDNTSLEEIVQGVKVPQHIRSYKSSVEFQSNLVLEIG